MDGKIREQGNRITHVRLRHYSDIPRSKLLLLSSPNTEKGRFLMKLLLVAAITCCVSVVTSLAQADTSFSGANLQALIKGKTIRFTNGGTARYRTNGKHSYSIGRRTWRGQWVVSGNKVCAHFESSSRCDRYIQVGEDIFLINRRGKRFKVNSIK